jgi:heme-degrading monooxygenase HmoA
VQDETAVILEHAVLDVVPGQEDAFHEAFAVAKDLISAATGFRSLRLGRCVEAPNRYVLLVEWERLEDHMVGFRGSAPYQEWRALLHHFYDPFPHVEHYEDLVTESCVTVL